MEYYVDIADIETVRAVNDCYPIDGFTTNPNILTKAARPLPDLFREYRDYVRETGQRLFVQVTAERAEDMVEQAQALRAFFDFLGKRTDTGGEMLLIAHNADFDTGFLLDGGDLLCYLLNLMGIFHFRNTDSIRSCAHSRFKVLIDELGINSVYSDDNILAFRTLIFYQVIHQMSGNILFSDGNRVLKVVHEAVFIIKTSLQQLCRACTAGIERSSL